MTEKTMQIRNSTVDFLVFTKQNSKDSIEVRVQDENVWLTQDGISRLFDKGLSTITEHLNSIFAEGELKEDSVCRNFRLTAADGKIEKSDVSIAKNYLSKEELDKLERFVSMYLDYAEFQAKKHIPMTMEDWAVRLNKFLDFNEMEILQDKGHITAEIAKSFAETEFEKYRVIQDKLFQSDFDLFLEETQKIDK